ncbi:MAG TPA: hypothetical protein VMU50_13130 [Polyangia bacterium]|nr:hypothetical protein [Polyangia bacterium]
MTNRRPDHHPLALGLAALAAAQLIAATASAQTPPAQMPATAPAQAYPPPPTPPAPPAYPPPPAPVSPPTSGPTPAQPPPGYPPPGYSLPPPAGNGPVLSLFADNPRARLQMQLLENQWTDVCAVPCGRPVNPQGVFRVAGGTIQPSSPFQLPRPDGQVMVRARTGSKVKRWVGFGLAMGGVAGAAAGGLYLAAASNTSKDFYGNNTTTHDFYEVAGITYLVVGVVLMAIGFPMFASQGTSVEVR